MCGNARSSPRQPVRTKIIQPVHRGIAHLHSHLTRAGIGDRDVFAVFQNVWAAVPVENDRSHENLGRAPVQGRTLKVKGERRGRSHLQPVTFHLSAILHHPH